MQSQFSPPITRLDAVLWFLRVQLWLSVVTLLSSFLVPYSFLVGIVGQNLLFSALPILILVLFPRVLASAMLGQSAGEELSSLNQLRPLVGRCVGVTLFVGSLGRAVLLSFGLAAAFYSRGSSIYGTAYSPIFFTRIQLVGTALSFFLGFALAFGPAIRDNFRAR